MSLNVHFNDAASLPSGFMAEQMLHNRGFYEIGRRTDAAAWTRRNGADVIRISQDATGSREFFTLAQKMAGNPYMPIVHDQATLPSGEHIVCVEKLYSPLHDFPKVRDIREKLTAGRVVDEHDLAFKNRVESIAVECDRLSHIFMYPKTSRFDIETLPEPQAFKEAAIAMLELTGDLHQKDRRYFPSVDFNPTNIFWRDTVKGLQPVLYDPVSRQYDIGMKEREHSDFLRARFGLAPVPVIMSNHGPV